MPIPVVPFTRSIGTTGSYYSGSTSVPSSSTYVKSAASSFLNTTLEIGLSAVKIYLGDAESFPPINRDPN